MNSNFDSSDSSRLCPFPAQEASGLGPVAHSTEPFQLTQSCWAPALSYMPELNFSGLKFE